MNGSWILWWQLGSNYFITRKDMTSAYNGLLFQPQRGPADRSPHPGGLPRGHALTPGGAGFGAAWSSCPLYSWWQARSEKADGSYPTFSDKEHDPR